MAVWTSTAGAKQAATTAHAELSADNATIQAQSRPVGTQTSTVMFYLLLALLALAPGLFLKFGLTTGIDLLDASLRRLQAQLDDIRFGSGPRFWMGGTGASVMALLLLYPLRKFWPNAHWLGRIGSWFNIHLLFGVAGPVLILYHCNFGLGGFNANVALWAMLVVAVSGLAGHFVYAGISAGFYAQQQTARQEREALSELLGRFSAYPETRDQLLAALSAFDAKLLTPHRGVVAALTARMAIERERARLARGLGNYINAATQIDGLDSQQCGVLRSLLATHFANYIALTRAAATRSIREQIWARWRLFHLPVFLLMVVAAGLHVAAVWNMDNAELSAPETASPIIAQPIVAAAPANETITKPPAPTPPTPESAARLASAPPTAIKVPTSLPATAPAFDLEPRLINAPKPATRSIVSGKSEGAPPQAVETGVTVKTAPPTPPRHSPASPLPSDTDQILAELQRRSSETQMSLGGAKPRSLADQIATLKERQRTGTFSHSDAETGFALVGKHRNVDCASCHTKPLRETRSESPRACISCHKEDDVHRGRRPDCARCHTPTRWSDIQRRR